MKWNPSGVPKIPTPAPASVNTPLEYVALPVTPAVPMSASSHGTGSGCEVIVNTNALLSFMLGATETSISPDVAPEGIVTVIELLLQALTVTGVLFKKTSLPD